MQAFAVLLEYCLSDLSAEYPADCKKLDGLPLLMGQDSNVAKIRVGRKADSPLYLMTEEDAKVLAKLETYIVMWKVKDFSFTYSS